MPGSANCTTDLDGVRKPLTLLAAVEAELAIWSYEIWSALRSASARAA